MLLLSNTVLALAQFGPTLRAPVDGDSTAQCAYAVFVDVEPDAVDPKRWALVLRGQDKTIVGRGKGVSRAEFKRTPENGRAEMREALEQWNDSSGKARSIVLGTFDDETSGKATAAQIVAFFVACGKGDANTQTAITGAITGLTDASARAIVPALLNVLGARTPTGGIGSYAELKGAEEKRRAKALADAKDILIESARSKISPDDKGGAAKLAKILEQINAIASA